MDAATRREAERPRVLWILGVGVHRSLVRPEDLHRGLLGELASVELCEDTVGRRVCGDLQELDQAIPLFFGKV
jgi:hypothetical protein